MSGDKGAVELNHNLILEEQKKIYNQVKNRILKKDYLNNLDKEMDEYLLSELKFSIIKTKRIIELLK